MSKDYLPTDIPMMSYTVVFKNEKYELQIRVLKMYENQSDPTVNVWDLGENEEIAQSRATTILESYAKGLEHVQEQVRSVFAEQEDA